MQWHGGSRKVYTYEVHPINVVIQMFWGTTFLQKKTGNKWEAV